MIKTIAKSLNPTLYEQREAEAAIEKSSWKKLLPIFYYNATMFPGETLSLHLFEPRYKLMMQRVVNSTRAFAYVPNFVSYCARDGDLALVAELKETEFLAGDLVTFVSVIDYTFVSLTASCLSNYMWTQMGGASSRRCSRGGTV